MEHHQSNAQEHSQDETIEMQLQRAASDLMCLTVESGENFIVFMDRRRLRTRVDQLSDGNFGVRWEDEQSMWISYQQSFKNLREAAFHAYQGPH